MGQRLVVPAEPVVEERAQPGEGTDRPTLASLDRVLNCGIEKIPCIRLVATPRDRARAWPPSTAPCRSRTVIDSHSAIRRGGGSEFPGVDVHVARDT